MRSHIDALAEENVPLDNKSWENNIRNYVSVVVKRLCCRLKRVCMPYDVKSFESANI